MANERSSLIPPEFDRVDRFRAPCAALEELHMQRDHHRERRIVFRVLLDQRRDGRGEIFSVGSRAGVVERIDEPHRDHGVR